MAAAHALLSGDAGRDRARALVRFARTSTPERLGRLFGEALNARGARYVLYESATDYQPSEAAPLQVPIPEEAPKPRRTRRLRSLFGKKSG